MSFAVGTMTSMGVVICFAIGTALVLMGAYTVILMGTTFTPKMIYVGVALFVADIIIYYTTFEVAKVAHESNIPSTIIGKWFANIEPINRWIVMATILAIGVIRVIWVRRTIKTTITQFSVGETLDLIPLGVAFSNKYGQIMQANETINNLSYELTGKVLVDENDFWNKISSGDIISGTPINMDLGGITQENEPSGWSYGAGEAIRDEKNRVERPVIALSDGSVWLFEKTTVESEVGPVSQILAVDATKEEELVRELEHGNQQLRDMNRRLRRYHEEVDDTVRSEELLEAKMRVHDRMGETLLAAKIYLTNEESPVDAATVLKSWEEDLTLLREEAKGEEAPKQVERFMDAAKHLGIDLQIAGEIPENREVMNLICVGIQECMTNALQHSEATQMYVTILKDDFGYTVNYSDNGKTPKYPIKEGGGLRLLRETAENMEATMKYVEGRHFQLALEIPRPDSDL